MWKKLKVRNNCDDALTADFCSSSVILRGENAMDGRNIKCARVGYQKRFFYPLRSVFRVRTYIWVRRWKFQRDRENVRNAASVKITTVVHLQPTMHDSNTGFHSGNPMPASLLSQFRFAAIAKTVTELTCLPSRHSTMFHGC